MKLAADLATNVFASLIPFMPQFPQPQAAPPPPAIDPQAQRARDAAAEEERKRGARGRASTFATPGGERGDLEEANVAGKSLLGL